MPRLEGASLSVPAGPRLDRGRLAALLERERRRFAEEHPRSRALFERDRGSLLGGVPMSWMARWAGGFPVFLHEAQGARVVDRHTAAFSEAVEDLVG